MAYGIRNFQIMNFRKKIGALKDTIYLSLKQNFAHNLSSHLDNILTKSSTKVTESPLLMWKSAQCQPNLP